MFRTASLRQLLILPFVVLVLTLATVLGGLSYLAGRTVIDRLSERWLVENADRIAQAVQRRLDISGQVLDIAFPPGEPAPQSISAGDRPLRERFWLATLIQPQLNDYAYYADEQGRFFALYRKADGSVDLQVLEHGSGSREFYVLRSLYGELEAYRTEAVRFDPRTRPWYRTARANDAETWSPVYIDFNGEDLETTLARPVRDAQGRFAGIAATDVTLRQLSDIVRTLQPSSNGVSFVVESDGALIATSRGAVFLAEGGSEEARRINAATSDDVLLASAYRGVDALLHADGQGRSADISGPDGRDIQVAYARLAPRPGLEWIVGVAVPRREFLHDITAAAWGTLALSLLAALLVVGVGWAVLRPVTRDLHAIAEAAHRVGDGDFDVWLDLRRGDEIGALARSFAAMTEKLATDRLTGLDNREATLRRIDDRIARHRSGAKAHPFALLFLDVDGFKAVNDRLGHEAGDAVLQELAQRMRASVRQGDLVARWAGDEFLIVLDGVGEEELAMRLADQIGAELREPIEVAGGLPLGVSIGIAQYPRDAEDARQLIALADADMYRRKHASR